MKQIRSYTSIWNVEKVLYAIEDLQLPFPITFSQLGWLVGTFCFVLMFQDMPPLSMIDNVIIKYAAIPIGVMWFMSKKTFDGKKPYSFIRSVLAYQTRQKVTYAGKTVKKMQKRKAVQLGVTAVRSVIYEPETVSD